jgi:hypothetical protein
MNRIRRSLVFGSSFVILTAMLVVPSTSARAYGAATWQVAFSGNFNNATAGGGSSGFWGWCDFAGGVQSGDDADCSVSNYFFQGGGASTGFSVTERIQGTAWDVEPTTFPTPGFPPNDFFITSGTVTISGPTIVKAIASGFVPPSCALRGNTATCPIPVLEAAGIYAPDTGVPAAAGHYSLSKIVALLGGHVPPGTHINIQVSRIH